MASAGMSAIHKARRVSRPLKKRTDCTRALLPEALALARALSPRFWRLTTSWPEGSSDAGLFSADIVSRWFADNAKERRWGFGGDTGTVVVAVAVGLACLHCDAAWCSRPAACQLRFWTGERQAGLCCGAVPAGMELPVTTVTNPHQHVALIVNTTLEQYTAVALASFPLNTFNAGPLFGSDLDGFMIWR